MLARFAGTSEEPARIAHVDLRLVARVAVHVDLVVPALDRERAVRRKGRVVRRRDAEVELVFARLRESRHIALPFARFVAELARKRIKRRLHMARHVRRNHRRLRHASVAPVCSGNLRIKRRRVDHNGKCAVVARMVRRGRLELDDVVAGIRERRSNSHPLIRSNAVLVRNRLVVPNARYGRRRSRMGFAVIGGFRVFKRRTEHGVRDGILRPGIRQ